jgi:hypothetical protein
MLAQRRGTAYDTEICAVLERRLSVLCSDMVSVALYYIAHRQRTGAAASNTKENVL